MSNDPFPDPPQEQGTSSGCGWCQKLTNKLRGAGWKTDEQIAQEAINQGEPPNGEYSFVFGKSCPDCKYYPKEVVEAVNAHEDQHAKDENTVAGFKKLFSKAGQRELEVNAFKAELSVEERNIKALEGKGSAADAEGRKITDNPKEYARSGERSHSVSTGLHSVGDAMNRNRSLKLAALVVLGLLAIILYADLRSVHQIYRISEVMISNAPDATSREGLIADRDRRDREERRHKTAIEAALAVDIVLLLWVAASLLRRPNSRLIR